VSGTCWVTWAEVHGSQAREAHWASGIAVPSPPRSPQHSPHGITEVDRGPEIKWALLPREFLHSGRNQEAPSSLPPEWELLFGSFCHSIKMSTRGQVKGYFGLSNKMGKTVLKTQHTPPWERKKFHVYREEGAKGSIFFHNEEKSTGCSPKLQIYFSNSKYLY
jgi:hypothetical protein